MEPTDVLHVGSSIDIKRTDGRVHSAIVACINYNARTATVEWFEQGEARGKEVDMALIESLNPGVVVMKPPEDELILETTTQLQRNPSRQSIMTTTNNKATNGSIRSCRSQLRQTMHPPQPPQPPEPTPQVVAKENVASRGNNVTSQLEKNNARRSSVVKEVEKLKKNREERRQRQAEEKAEKEAFMQSAPGNPYWELYNMILEYRRGLDIKPISESDMVEDHLITVCVRKRPLNKKEMARKEVDVITIPSKNQLIVHEPKNKVDLTKYLENQKFRFDYAFDETCTNEIVYKYTAQPLIKTVFDGGFATCFAYGQTGSGKTHTMGGAFVGKTQDCHKGIYALAAADVFRFANSPKYRGLDLCVSASFFEIYSGKVFDLLNNKLKLRILEDGKQQVQVVGLTEIVVTNVEAVLKLIQKGNQARTSGQTSANSNSSRSHAVFQIILRGSNMSKIHGKFSLIDLAGNERGADTSSADRQTRMEGAEINKSLLALKECIRALGRKGAHLPFRVSKLTQVLRDSFVGSNSRTCMIAMVSPGVASCEHTLNTLRYADRVKELCADDLFPNQNEDAFNEKEEEGDLMQLRSLNENDMTPEMLNFHQMVSELQVAEEFTLENHKQTSDMLYTFADKAKALLRTTDNVEYDQEVYSKAWGELLIKCKGIIDRAIDINADFREKLTNEEQLSRKTNKRK